MKKKKTYISRCVYFLVSLFFLVIFLSPVSADEDNEENFMMACKKGFNPYENRATPLKQFLPEYPRTGLINGLEANLLIEFIVNKQGDVEEPYVVWQDQTGEYRQKRVFVTNALKSVKKYKYEPKRNKKGEALTSVERVKISFRIEGNEDILAIENRKFSKILKKFKRSRNNKSEESILFLEQLNVEIDGELEEDLPKIVKAAFLYLKASILIDLDASTELIKKVLLKSKSNYEFEIIETLEEGIEVRSVTSEKLNSFGSLLLANLYFKENNYKEVEHELVHLFNSTQKNRTLRKRFYRSWLQLGVASYTLNNWCNASQALSKAKVIGQKTGLSFPSYLEEPLKYANSQVE